MQRRSPVDRLIVCVLVFAAVYPLVTGLTYLMQYVTPTWQLWQRHLVIVPVIVSGMVFAIMPAINRIRG
jgi:antibiotic biosynthesis monooxygenase (ABM) superfamily enzyme